MFDITSYGYSTERNLALGELAYDSLLGDEEVVFKVDASDPKIDKEKFFLNVDIQEYHGIPNISHPFPLPPP